MEAKKQLVYKEDILAMAWLADECEVVTALDIEDMPTVDAVEVVHGRWEEAGFDGHGDYKECCSNCKAWSIGADKLFCPVCGAKMDGDEIK